MDDVQIWKRPGNVLFQYQQIGKRALPRKSQARPLRKDGFSQLPKNKRNEVVVSIPSGNFGNLCAGIIAKTLGLPIKRFIAATNLNDTVPRYLQSGKWQPKKTIATMSNAMDVSKPNNWPRIEYLMDTDQFDRNLLTGVGINEEQTTTMLQSLYHNNYISEPHAAVAYKGLTDSLQNQETGIFLGTAHPAKFKDASSESSILFGGAEGFPVSDKGTNDISLHSPSGFGSRKKAIISPSGDQIGGP